MSDEAEIKIEFDLKEPDQWDRWSYILNDMLQEHGIIDLLNATAATRAAAIPERPVAATYGGAGAMSVRMQSEYKEALDDYKFKDKGRTLAANFIQKSTLKHLMETVREIPRNDIYLRYVALRDHIRPLSNIAINGRLIKALEIKQTSPTRLAAQQFGQQVDVAVNDIASACRQAGITLEEVIRQAILVKGMFTQAQQIQIYKTTIAGNTTITVQQIRTGLVSVSEHVEAEGPNYMRAHGKPRAFAVSESSSTFCPQCSCGSCSALKSGDLLTGKSSTDPTATCSTCPPFNGKTHTNERCYKQHPELRPSHKKQKPNKGKGGAKAAVAEVVKDADLTEQITMLKTQNDRLEKLMAGSKSGSIACASGVPDSITDEGCLWSLSGVEVISSSIFSSENFSVPLVVAPPDTPDEISFGPVV